MKVKRKVVARIFVYSLDTQHAEITAASKSDLVQQLKELSGGNTQAAQLAKLAWTDERSDITIGLMRLACIGHFVKETWATSQRPATAKNIDLEAPIQPQMEAQVEIQLTNSQALQSEERPQVEGQQLVSSQTQPQQAQVQLKPEPQAKVQQVNPHPQAQQGRIRPQTELIPTTEV